MNYSKITRYDKCGLGISRKHDVEPHGYPNTKTTGEMIDLAIQNECKLILKNGKNGKWYLKGQNKTIEFLKKKISEKVGTESRDVFCLLIE